MYISLVGTLGLRHKASTYLYMYAQETINRLLIRGTTSFSILTRAILTGIGVESHFLTTLVIGLSTEGCVSGTVGHFQGSYVAHTFCSLVLLLRKKASSVCPV